MNATTNSTGVRTFVCAADIEPYHGVKFDAGGSIVLAGLTDRPIGFTIDRGFDGAGVAVALANAPGSVEVRLSAAVAAHGAAVYQLAGGQFSGTNPGTALQVGKALTVGGAGDTIEMMPINIA